MKVTIITGASRGIGKAITENLKDIEGAHIHLSSKNVDFEDYLEVHRGLCTLLECFSDITELNVILCAAQIGRPHSLAVEDFDKLYKINVLGNYAVIDAACFYNLQAKIRVVWFAGGGAAFPYPELPAYSASKVAVVRTVENISKYDIFDKTDFSIIALAPGAVETDMLKTVLDAGCEVRTRTDISEPVNFVRKFITDQFDSKSLNGMFLHVRDIIPDGVPIEGKKDLFKLRRIE